VKFPLTFRFMDHEVNDSSRKCEILLRDVMNMQLGVSLKGRI